MKMTIKRWFRAVNSVSNHPVGTMLPMSGCEYEESGWKSVKEFQKARLSPNGGNHPREIREKIDNGIRITEKSGSFGFVTVLEITLS